MSGRFTRLRYVFFAVLIVVYIALPFIQIGGHPAVFLDVAARKFYLFGGTFNAQDFWLVFFLLSGAGLALIVVTTLWGRVWCGYACPQTVFLEGIYRRIERWIEGPRAERLRRNAARVSWSKVWRKTLKHGLFALVSVVLAHFFLSYFVSLPSLFAMIQQRPTAHIEAFVWMAAMSGIL
ncbi:MAG: 4Fe-4S binding protein, partial [Rhodocyclaceae bacterium]|nr:4Fe-4S binding protein [Rhodocyclaceae bacterium]